MRRHGGAMFADKSKTRDTRVLLAILWKYLSEFKNQVIGVSFIILFYAIAATYQPIIIKDAIDLVLTDANDNQIFILITIFFVLAVIVWSLQSINTWIITGIRTQLVNKVRSDSFEKLVEADMSFHHKNQSGNVTARVVNDTQDIATGLQVVSTVTTQLLLIIATLIVLFSIGWMFVLISLLAVPTAMIIAKFFGTIGKKRMLATRQTYGQVSGRLAENLAGVSIAKAFNQEEKVSKEIESLNYKAYGYMKQLIVVFILVFPSISMVSTILVFGVLMLGGYLTTTSDITVGTIFLATIMVQRFLQPVIQLANNYTQLQASLAALDRVADVLEAKPSVQNKENAIPLKFNAGKVEFSDVSFEYIKDTPVLQHISFDVSAGSKIALVGHTGAGKTTITSLLMRFYDPKQGFIAIDDQKLIDITLESLYQTVSIVSQEPYLFADTVLENIRYGKPNATDTDIFDLCQLIGADLFIEALPQSYQTVLQESGKSLSAGQRQMITIARTMLSDPKILILDEATSRLDAYSESLVQNAQKLLFKGRTTIIIAHRLSTIRDVDKIIVFDHGKLIEEGNHDQLYQMKGKYFELYNMYYAHQGLTPLQLAEITTEGTSTTYELNGRINLSTLIKDRIEFAKEMYTGSSIESMNISNNAMVDGNVKDYQRIIDLMLQKIHGYHKHFQSKNPIQIGLIVEEDKYQLVVQDMGVTIPSKMMKMMGSNSAHGANHGNNGPSIEEIVKSIEGEYQMISPITDSGTKLVTKFKLTA